MVMQTMQIAQNSNLYLKFRIHFRFGNFSMVNTETMWRVCAMFTRVQLRYLPAVIYAKLGWFSDIRKSSPFFLYQTLFSYIRNSCGFSDNRNLYEFLIAENYFLISENDIRELFSDFWYLKIIFWYRKINTWYQKIIFWYQLDRTRRKASEICLRYPLAIYSHTFSR